MDVAAIISQVNSTMIAEIIFPLCQKVTKQYFNTSEIYLGRTFNYSYRMPLSIAINACQLRMTRHQTHKTIYFQMELIHEHEHMHGLMVQAIEEMMRMMIGLRRCQCD